VSVEAIWGNLDFSGFTDTTLPTESTLQLRAEFFNIFNHSTFNSPTQGSDGSVPGAQITSPTFGLATATAYTERWIQLDARFIF
jgi:hypothetical protein